VNERERGAIENAVTRLRSQNDYFLILFPQSRLGVLGLNTR
jgi:hypothetical protein